MESKNKSITEDTNSKNHEIQNSYKMAQRLGKNHSPWLVVGFGWNSSKTINSQKMSKSHKS